MNEKSVYEITLGRTLAGTIGGAGAVILAILGLANIYPAFMVSIATIAIGATLVFKSLAIAAEYPRLVSQTVSTGSEVGSGMSAEFLAGAAGIILGILSLLGLEFQTLTSIAVIVFGAGLIFGSTVVRSLNSLRAQALGAEGITKRVSEEIVSAAMGTQVLVGIGAVVLGILSLMGFQPLNLTLIALLAIGATTLFLGSALTGKFVHMIRH